MERIGGYAKNTAKRSRHLVQPLSAEFAEQFLWMGERIQSMLSQVTESYIHYYAPLANVARTDDAELDTVFANLFQHLLRMMSQESRTSGTGLN